MRFFSIFLTGFALSMDAFAVSITKGITIKKVDLLTSIKIASSFALFQGIMPLIGWLCGINFELYIRGIDHWIAFFLLLFIGGNMIKESRRPHNKRLQTYGLEPFCFVFIYFLSSIKPP